MQLTPLPTLVYTRETDTLRSAGGARIERFANTAHAAIPQRAQFQPLGRSFEAAVRTANHYAKVTTDGQAQAIVQGVDGAYFLTPLLDAHGTPLPFDGITNDPHPTDKRGRRQPLERVVHTDWVLRIDPSVRAVVGGRSWANFTTHRVEFGLELLQSATKGEAR